MPLIDRDQHGPIPRVNLSLKLSSLTTHFDPIHAEATIAGVAERLRPILRTARELGAYVHVDMEQYTYRPSATTSSAGSSPSPSSATGPTSASSSRPISPRPRPS